MGKYCPLLQKEVVYLECQDCEDSLRCRKGEIKEPTKDKKQKYKNWKRK